MYKPSQCSIINSSIKIVYSPEKVGQRGFNEITTSSKKF